MNDAQIRAAENPAASTEITEAGGRKLLINKQTGEIIADLGTSGSGSGSSGGGFDLSSLISMLGGNKDTYSEVTSPQRSVRIVGK